MPNILVVEDEAIIRNSLKKLLENNAYNVSVAESVDAALQHDIPSFDLIISDLRLPGRPGSDMIRLAKSCPVLIMTSYASMQSAVDSMKAGAVDYIAKPFDHDELLITIETILDNHRDDERPAANNREHLPPLAGFIGDCPPMQAVYSQISKVANTNTTVLVSGQTGTGKELVAKAIHQQSPRAHKPLISVNCAAIPETLIESELFGYEKGAFTGANTSRGGLIEAAEGGTLFLDEIGELPLQAQARLLRFLQEGEIRAVGSLETKKVDVRLVAATHRDLKALASKGDFRQDLYYRIAVFTITLPPLAERGKDILDIAEALLAKYSQQFNKPRLQFSPKAIQAITSYRWPGNVRELQNAIERAAILTEQNDVDYELLGIDIELVNVRKLRQSKTPVSTITNSAAVASDPNEDLSLEDYFQRFVLEHQHTMSETELAKKLGISRKCLWERRQRFDLPRNKATAGNNSRKT